MKRASRLASLAALGLVVACASMPTVTRTGKVHDILIQEQISPADVTVRPGDEVRWVNRRQADVRIIFLAPISDTVSCRRGFSGLVGTKNETRLRPNETVSLCFGKSGSHRYAARMETALPSGELNVPGIVRVEEPL